MAEEVAALQYRLEATTARFESQIKRAERVMERSAGNIERRARQTDQRLSNFGSRFGIEMASRAIAAAGGIAAVGTAIRATVRAGDQLRQLNGRFEALTGSAERASELVRGVFNVSRATGTGTDTIGQLVTQFRLATEQIGASDAQVIQFTQSLTQLGAIGGSSAGEIANGLRQLSQGLAGGILRAEEFNSVIENTPLVARALAQELAGGSLGALREMVLEGRVLSEDVFRAILNQSGQINEQFQQIPDNLERATSRLNTALTEMLAALDSGLGISQAFADVIARLAREIREVTDPGAELRAAIEQSRREPGLFNTPPVTPTAEPAASPRPAATRQSRRSATSAPSTANRSAFDDALQARQIAQRTDIRRLRIANMPEDQRADALNRLEAELVEARVAEELLAAAVRQNTAEGRANTAATFEQQAAIAEAATAAGALSLELVRVADAAEQAAEQRRAVDALGQSLVSAAVRASSLEDALVRVAQVLAESALTGLLSGTGAFAALGQAVTGGAGGLVGAAFGGGASPDVGFTGGTSAPSSFFTNSNGNAFSGGRVIPFASGGVVSGPTTFPMAGGNTGLMGEAGPEAIMPLRRGPGGRLGVEASGGGGVNVHNTYHFAPGVDAGALRAEGERIKRETISAIVAARRENKGFLA